MPVAFGKSNLPPFQPLAASLDRNQHSPIGNSWPGSPMAVNTPALGNSSINNQYQDGSSLVHRTLEVWGEQRVAGWQIADDEGDSEEEALGKGEDGSDEGGWPSEPVGTSENGESSKDSTKGLEDEEGADEAEGHHWRHPAPKMEDMIHEFTFDDLRHAFPESNLPSFKAACRQVQYLSKYQPQTYDCCINCCMCYVGVHANLTHCLHCQEPRLDAHSKPHKKFNYIPFIPRLTALYSNPEMVEKMQYRHNFQSNEAITQDLYDGMIYNSLCSTYVNIGGTEHPHRFFEADTDIALGLATDGFAPFCNCKQTCRPILVYNLNLPPDERFLMENLICVGVVPGPKKPKDFNSFLYPFVSESLELALGVDAYHSLRQCMFLLRTYLLFGGGDMPAVAMMMLMKRHNGISPCCMCKIVAICHQGSNTYYVPLCPPHTLSRTLPTYNPFNFPICDHDGFLKDACHVQMAPSQAEADQRARDSGVKGVPILSHIPSLIFPHSFPLDLMHLLWENLIKNLLDFFCRKFKDLDHDEEGIELSKLCGRQLEMQHNTNMLSFWTLFLGPIYLEQAFASPRFYVHFVELVKLLNLCLQFELQ
ncbi:hypothetical protein H1R20_g9645, partial [Candolleomyces eurysporus]